MTEVLNPNHSPSHFSPSSSSPSPSSSSHIQNEDNNRGCECGLPSSSVAEERDSIVIGCEEEEAEGDRQRRDQLSLLALLLALFRRSLVACKSTDRRELCAMEIGLPTNVRHVAHVTFDRFNGFLGLPVEFEPEVPRRPPSARYCECGFLIFIIMLIFGH